MCRRGFVKIGFPFGEPRKNVVFARGSVALVRLATVEHDVSKRSIARPLGLALLCVLAGLITVPGGFEAGTLLSLQDDPPGVADHMLGLSFDRDVARREIESALAAGDPDLAASFLALARDRNVQVDAELAARVEAANALAASAARTAGSFARGLITGEPGDMAGLAGTAVGDLFVFGDIRDALREGTRFARGEPTDKLILGLACAGLAITAGTYATAGAAAPARVGLSLAKAARATGRMSTHLAQWVGRSLRDALDWEALGRAIGSARLSGPVVAVRAAREAVKVDKATELVRFAGDLGRVESKAGAGAALDALKIAEGPQDMSRIAKLAEKYGGKTRAVLKLGGRAAIMLMMGAFHLASWVFSAILTLFGFCASCKRAAERATERYLLRRKARARSLEASAGVAAERG
jgi:hypothetical protein